jgi:rod shape determining protein RodA
LLAFVNPNLDPLGAGYTIIQSKIAIGSGGLFGKGLLKGTQSRLCFLPEGHTDFVFASIAEQWGLVGICLLLILYYLLIKNLLLIAYKNTTNPCACLFILGTAGLLLLHIGINIGMCMGLLPVVGLSLPFISYGGSNLVTFIFAIFLIIDIQKKK